MRHFENLQVLSSTNENDFDLGSADTGPYLLVILAEKTQRSCDKGASLSLHVSQIHWPPFAGRSVQTKQGDKLTHSRNQR